MKTPRYFYAGLQIANLTLIKRTKKGHNGKWKCVCKCGNIKEFYSHEIGVTNFSCGCSNEEFKPKSSFFYTDEECQFLIKYCSLLSVRELAVILGRSYRSVREKLRFEGVSLLQVKNQKREKWNHEEVQFLKENYLYLTTKEIAKKLNKTEYSVRGKKKDLGIENKIKVQRENVIIGNRKSHQGYYRILDYEKGTIVAHRKVYEDFYNIKLSKNEKIHHIDGNKENNDISNLFKCNSNRHHYLVHSQLQKVAYSLIQKGIIKFDKEKGEYYV